MILRALAVTALLLAMAWVAAWWLANPQAAPAATLVRGRRRSLTELAVMVTALTFAAALVVAG